MEQEAYVFIRDYSTSEGVIKANSELRKFRGHYYINGGMILSAYSYVFDNLLNDKNLKDYYLKKIDIVFNKC